MATAIFVDFNQMARDRLMASAYSIRPVEDARVSAPLAWDEIRDADPAAFTVLTMPDPVRRARRRLGRALSDAAGVPRPRAGLVRPGRRRGRGRAAVSAGLPEDAGRADAGAAEPGQERPDVNVRRSLPQHGPESLPMGP